MSVARDFTWVETDEPHATRRKLILAKHPEIKDLFKPEPMTFWVVLGIFFLQLSMAYMLRDSSWGLFLLCAYLVGGTVNHTLQLAVHDLSHNLCFESIPANRVLSIFANLVTGFPSAVTFCRYHMEHHQFQGADQVDTDVPTMAEVRFFTNAPLKLLWLFMQPVFYAFRPLLVKPKTPTPWEAVNWFSQVSFNLAVYYFLGGQALAYLVVGTLLGMGVHPCAGHFVAEHYELSKGHETYSYYGILNFFNLNVGYHNEHHDFPKVPWTKLPQVRAMAPEFYNHLPAYDSYIKVFYRYVTDPTVGPHSRVKRNRVQIKQL